MQRGVRTPRHQPARTAKAAINKDRATACERLLHGVADTYNRVMRVDELNVDKTLVAMVTNAGDLDAATLHNF